MIDFEHIKECIQSRYRPGDKILLKSIEEINETLDADDYSTITSIYMNDMMKSNAGKVITISRFSDKGVLCDDCYCYSYEWFNVTFSDWEDSI